jgi:hypothetical protein
MAAFTLQSFKAGQAPRSVEFADEQSAYSETMRLQRSGTVDALTLTRVKDRKVLFDTTNGAPPGLALLPAKRSKLPLLAVAAIAMGFVIALALAFFKHR